VRQKSIDALNFRNLDWSTLVGTSQFPFGMNALLYVRTGFEFRML
jgi:hypothetical protein